LGFFHREPAAVQAALYGWLALEPGTAGNPALRGHRKGTIGLSDGDGLPDDGPWPDHKILSRQELNVLEAIAAGKPNKAIAGELSISESTVKFHLRSLFRKLEAQNRAQLISRAFSRGLLII
jgi:DNA-binding NarL/FixJ family response regulator